VLGVLDAGPTGAESSLRLVSDDDDPSRAPWFAFDGRVVGRDRFGHWRVEGVATIDGARQPLALAVTYRGVYPGGSRPVAWLSIVEADDAGGADRPRNGIRRITGELNALAPTARPAPATRRPERPEQRERPEPPAPVGPPAPALAMAC
jgi:hypothetical protein